VVVVSHVVRQDGPQVRLVDDDPVVQALRADGADGAWGGILTTVRPSLAKTVSKLAGNLPSRSRMLTRLRQRVTMLEEQVA